MSQDVDGLVREALLGGIGPDMNKQGFQSFSVFYSNPYVTLKKGDYYIVGLNPGGAGESQEEINEYEWIQVNWGLTPKSAYLIEDDPTWDKKNLQRNMQLFANCWLQDDKKLRDIFSTNAIFARSPHVDSLNEKTRDLFELCWPWHHRFLDIIRPRIIIAISNDDTKPSAFNLFRDRLQEHSTEEPIKVYGRYSIKRCSGKIDLSPGQVEVRLVGLPHLSRCNVAGQRDVISKLKKDCWL